MAGSGSSVRCSARDVVADERTAAVRSGRTVLDALVRQWLRLPWFARVPWPAVAMLVLWWSSSQQPTVRTPSQLRAVLHNGMHLVAYGGLAASWLLALLRRDVAAPLPANGPWIAFVATVAYGVVDELHQSFVPDRVCSIADLVTDAAAAATVLLALRAHFAGRQLSWRWWATAVATCVGCVLFATWGPW